MRITCEGKSYVGTVWPPHSDRPYWKIETTDGRKISADRCIMEEE